jgi:hypothetical protein
MNKRRRNRLKEACTASPNKAGWRISEWTEDTGLSRAYVYILINENKISSVKSGAARIITTSPAAYLGSLEGAATSGTPPGRRAAR